MEPKDVEKELQNALDNAKGGWKDEGYKKFSARAARLTDILRRMQNACEKLDDAKNDVISGLSKVKGC